MLGAHGPQYDVVLVGGGHAHVEVLRQAALRRPAHVRLTLVAREAMTPYSGMLPGLIAGQFHVEDCFVDLWRLCRAAGARMIHDEVRGIDLAGSTIHCGQRGALAYDKLSLDIGSTPDLAGVAGAADHALPVKPVPAFRRRWAALERTLGPDRTRTIVVVGGGAGGVELCLSLQHRVRGLAKTARLRQGGDDAVEDDSWARFVVVSGTDRILPGHRPGVRRAFERELARRGVELRLGQPVVSVEPAAVVLADGTRIDADATIWTTSASAPAWLRDTGLGLDERGFVMVNQYLQSRTHAEVFAAGDIAAFGPKKLAKSGVHAVRQGVTLAANLLATPDRPLRAHAPQSNVLALVSTGYRDAVVSHRWLPAARGLLVWLWKERIDRRWMRMYQNLRPNGRMAEPEIQTGMLQLPADDHREPLSMLTPAARAAQARPMKMATAAPVAMAPMRCAGCGSKIGGEALSRALAAISVPVRADVPIGLAEREDASAILVPAGQALVQSVDHLRALLDDPWRFARIATIHALSDLHASGARPHSALLTAIVGHGASALQERDLADLLRGVTEELDRAGAVLLGGHTIEGAEPGIGLTVNGLAVPETLLRKGGLQPGDALILTKPLGSGVLFATDMMGEACGPWIEAALESMLTSNGPASRLARAAGVRACTDVTGFGLGGHMLEMLRASGLDAELSLLALPAMEGALKCLSLGYASTLAPANHKAIRGSIDLRTRLALSDRHDLLFDPQTAGGLLIGIAAAQAPALLQRLRGEGEAPRAAIVGRVLARAGDRSRLTLVDGAETGR